MSRGNGSQPSRVPTHVQLSLRIRRMIVDRSVRVDDCAADGGTGLQAQLLGCPFCQSITDGFPGSQDIGSQRNKSILNECIETDLRHESVVPTISGNVSALARERTERTRPRPSRAVREEIRKIEKLTAPEPFGDHVALQPEYFRNLHLELEGREPSGRCSKSRMTLTERTGRTLILPPT
jgi:hypothetical protein